MDQQANLLDQILSGANRNLQVLAAQGLVPLPPDDLIPIQVALTASPDTEISSKAAETLLGIDPELAKNYLSDKATERELHYFGVTATQPAIQEAVLRRPDVPRPVLAEMAPHLSPDLQEILIHRQDAIMELPEILLELERNTALSNYTKRRIWEYREHLLQRDALPPKKLEEVQAEADALTEEEMQEAIAEIKAKSTAEDGDEGEVVDEERNLTDGEIRQLPVPMRVKLARNAPKQIRALLIRDSSAQVAVTVITGNNLPDSEVEAIANNRSVCEEVLAEIPKNREWIRKYSIAKALVRNPKTRLPLALRLVPRMAVRDLRELAKDKNVAEGVRQVALRLYQAKR